MDVKRLKEKVERIESFERKLGIEIKNISFKIDCCDYLVCFYEVHSDKGQIESSVEIDLVVYDKEGDIAYTKSSSIHKSDFLGFEVITEHLTDISEAEVDAIGKIKIYPKGY